MLREGIIKEITLLIVEDEQMIRELLADVLEDLTPNILLAENGLEALKLIEKNSVDIVLTDISMPRMNGDEMFFQLRMKKFAGEVIFLSAYADKALVQSVMREGAFDVIDKPIKEEILLSRVTHAIEKVISNRYEKQFFDTVANFLGYEQSPDFCSLDYKKRFEYLEGLLAILKLKGENKRNKI